MKKRRHFQNFDIAGFSYWDGAIVFNELKIGTELELELELDNRYDPRAVAVYFGEAKLGFVPRTCNDAISKLCEAGYSYIFDVRINRILYYYPKLGQFRKTVC
ncbi:MAG: HIRAN domain-containing protein [bacterium]